jgi:ABC-type multidrug transport system ATPase subunit
VHNPLIAVSGDIYLGNIRVDESNQDVIRRSIAYVGQEDVLHQQSTPREAIRFSARLRMGNEFSLAEIDELVESYIVELGLTKCADGLIGGELLKGISGGTRNFSAASAFVSFREGSTHWTSIRVV